MGVVDLLGIISFFLLSLVVRKLVVGYLKDTNAGECKGSGLTEVIGDPTNFRSSQVYKKFDECMKNHEY